MFSIQCLRRISKISSLCRGTGSTAVGINDQVGSASDPVPAAHRAAGDPLGCSEQCRPLERTAARAEREIELLREYRTRLIADVVTGKLDVRDAAARLPDDRDEPEPLDDIDLEPEDEPEAR